MIFGVLTFALILLFGSTPSVPSSLLVVTNYLVLSLMILLLGMLIGIGSLFFIKLSKSTSIILAIVGTVLFMITFFNLKGIIIYMYIPVLLYGLVGRMDKFVASTLPTNNGARKKFLR